MTPILHKKTFPELTTAELYDLLRVRSEVFVVEQDCVYQDMDNDEQVGFRQSSEPFILDGIPHIRMTLEP